MTTDGTSLLAYCHKNPDDDQARLVYADWLEEHGDLPQAEFVRVQLRRAALSEDHPDDGPLAEREQALLGAHANRWKTHLPRAGRSKFSFHRGLPTRYDTTGAAYLRRGRALRREAAIDGLRLRSFEGLLREILDAGLLAGIRHLDVSYEDLSAGDVTALAACPDLAQLRSLDVSNNTFGEGACRALVRSPHLARLTRLEASWCGRALLAALGDKAAAMRLRGFQMVRATGGSVDLAAMTRGPAVAALEQLGLSYNDLGDEGPRALAESPMMPHLRMLSLWGCSLDGGDLEALFSPGKATRLEGLGLDSNEIGPDGGRVLGSASCLGNLIRLELGETQLGDGGLVALAAGGALRSLRHLELASTGVGDEGLRALARSPLMRTLRALIVNDNQGVTGDGVRALLAASAGGALERLDLTDLGLGDEGARAVAESPGSASLRELWLDDNRIGPDGAAALAASPHLGNLKKLLLESNRLGARGAEALLGSPLPGRLTMLSLVGSRIGRDAKARLRALHSPPTRTVNV